jgi:hypothetical protein
MQSGEPPYCGVEAGCDFLLSVVLGVLIDQRGFLGGLAGAGHRALRVAPDRVDRVCPVWRRWA